MPQTSPPLSASLPDAAPERRSRFIYIATTGTAPGGGMDPVSESLVQSPAAQGATQGGAELRPLDAHGGKGAAASVRVLLGALAKIATGRFSGRLAGVHVNLAGRVSLARTAAMAACSHAVGVPLVLHVHAQLQSRYRQMPSALRPLVRRVFGLADTVVVLGPNARRFMTDELKVPADRVEIVISGVPAATQPRRVRRADGVQRVLFLGELGPGQGVDDLLDALARPGFDRERLEVTIGGEGDGERYRAKARELGIADFVQVRGPCDRQEASRLLADADVLVLPSHDEVLPLAVLEALANGVAVVCTPVGELPSLLVDERDTLYVKPGDVDGLAATLQRLLADPQLQERLALDGQARYRQQFSLANFLARVARVHRRTFGIAAESGIVPPR